MSKWICKCNAVNPILNWVCHNCGKDWVVEVKAENIKTISISKDDRIEVLEKQNKIMRDALIYISNYTNDESYFAEETLKEIEGME